MVNREVGSGAGVGPRHDDGSGTVLALGLAGVAAALLVATALAAGAVAGHARARTAADLGALAGAAVAVTNLRSAEQAEPCAVAAQVVQANEAALDTCEVLPGGRVRVAVVVPVPMSLPGGFGMASASALAGPEPG